MSAKFGIMHGVVTDIKASAKELGWVILATVLLTLLACFFLHYRLYVADVQGVTIVDFVSSSMGGDRPFVVDPLNRWEFPATWLLQFAAIIYATLGYPLRDLAGMGKVCIVLTGSRWRWWLAKCAWALLVTLLCFFTVLLTSSIYGVVCGAGLSTTLTVGVAELLSKLAYRFVSSCPDALGPIVGAVLVCCALALFQLACSVALGALPAYVVSVSVLIGSALCAHELLPGNYLMLFRYEEVAYGVAKVPVAVLVALSLAVGSVVVGGWVFVKSDLLDRGRLS